MTLKYLTSTTNRAGVTYYYLRRKGQAKIPLGRGPVDDPAFLARYAAALQSQPKPRSRAAEGSVASVCEAFRAGTTYGGYSASYRSILARHLDQIRNAYGTAPIAQLQAHHIRADIAKMEANPANSRLKTWRLICKLAYERNWSAINATDGVKRPKLPKTDGHAPWTAADIEAYRLRWPHNTVQRLAMELLFWTAARTIDAVSLSPTMVGADGILTFVQSKTGGKSYVPWSCPLPEWASDFEPDRDELLKCLRPGTFTLLETTAGRARSHKGLSNLISAGAKDAHLSGLTAHGLRKSRLTAIAESGGSASAIMSWGGHKSLSEAEAYVATANRKSLLIGTEQKQKSANTPTKSANTRCN